MNSLRKSRLLAFMLALVMVCSLLPMSAFAANESTDLDTANVESAGVEMTDAENTQEEDVPSIIEEAANPAQDWYDKAEAGTKAYTISTKEQLQYFAQLVNDKTDLFSGKTVTLGADIDLSGVAWQGIGVYNKSNGDTAFQGTFDGGNHTVSNVTFADNSTGNTYRGFFNQVHNGTVKNLTVSGNGFGANPPSGQYGGAMIVGFASNATIENCVAKGALSGTHNVAGIVVRIKDTTVKNCANEANLTGSYSKMGGIVNLSQNSQTGCLIEGCVNKGAITSTARGEDGVGGIIGYIGDPDDGTNPNLAAYVTIQNCENKGVITGTSTAAVGQIVGSPRSYWKIGDGNKGLTGQLAVGIETAEFLGFATVSGNTATYTGTLQAGNTYLVTAKGAKPVAQLGAGASITFDQTLATLADVSGITADGHIEKTETDKQLTFTVKIAQVGETYYNTLQAAIDAAQSGDTVTVLGQLQENVTINKNLTLALGTKALTSAITLEMAGDVIPTLKITAAESNTSSITMTGFTQEGYDFVWYTKEDKSAKAEKSGDAFVAELNATHIPGWEFTVTYDGNGGEGTVSAGTRKKGEAYTVSENAFSKTGHNFIGWNTKADGSGTSYAAGAQGPDGNSTLYAQWGVNKYTVTWVNGNDTLKTDSVAYGAKPAYTGATPTKDGHVFKNWNTAADGSGTALTGETTVTGEVTYYAQFMAAAVTAPNSSVSGTEVQGMDSVLEEVVKDNAAATDVKVQLVVADASSHGDKDKLPADVQKGTLLDISVMATVNGGSPAALKEIDTVLEIKLPYTFAAHNSVKVYRVHDGEAQAFTKLDAKPTGNFKDLTYYADQSKGNIYIYTSNFSLYAISNTPEVYSIKYMSGDKELPNEDKKSYSYGDTFDLPTPKWTGYTFAGWYTNDKFTGDKVEKILATDSGNKTFYAKWTGNQYKVTFNANGGTTPSTTEKMVTFGDTYGTLPTSTKEGLYFAGWYTAKEGGTRIYTTTKVAVAGEHTLYAHWSNVPVTGDNLSMVQVAALGGALVLSVAAMAAIIVLKKRKG